jgi:PleD family two-component response regulator
VISKTASFGVSSFSKGTTIMEVLENADKALYKSKEEGRNRVSYLDSISPHSGE